VGGRSNEVAKNAIDELRFMNLHTGKNSLLQGAYLRRANLTGAYLQDANLSEANLQGTNLTKANLFDANLQGAFLLDADLSGANLTYADLRGADLWMANFDEETILPDMSKWNAETELERFTDPNHPDFWETDER